MSLNSKTLPPLNALVAFDAAATSISFTQAAAKLFVTQGAISRQIRSLEKIWASFYLIASSVKCG